jgi:hypothetical protein
MNTEKIIKIHLVMHLKMIINTKKRKDFSENLISTDLRLSERKAHSPCRYKDAYQLIIRDWEVLERLVVSQGGLHVRRGPSLK